MGQKGFGNHGLMGAVFLAGVWAGIYVPAVATIAHQGGAMAWLAESLAVLGIVVGPVTLIAVGGDEFFGLVGVLASLLFGWIAARLAGWMALPADQVALLRLAAAAAAATFLCLCFRLAVWRADRKRDEGAPGAS